MSKDVSFFISHILESIDFVDGFISGVDKEQFMGNVEKQAAVVRMISVLGEASKSIPEEIRERYPDVPWKRIASMRDILVHGYFKVDLDVVWTVATEELEPLKQRLTEIQSDLTLE
jgi:uncharacterized protein with HEPN domain